MRDQDIYCLIEEIDQIAPENSVAIYRAPHKPCKELSEFFYHTKMHVRQIENCRIPEFFMQTVSQYCR